MNDLQEQVDRYGNDRTAWNKEAGVERYRAHLYTDAGGRADMLVDSSGPKGTYYKVTMDDDQHTAPSANTTTAMRECVAQAASMLSAVANPEHLED